MFYVYIVTNKNKILLKTGLAGALSVRLRQLESETSSESDGCSYLLYWESFNDVLQAIAREKLIKKLSKKKKADLINSFNPQWDFLNEQVCAEELISD